MSLDTHPREPAPPQGAPLKLAAGLRIQDVAAAHRSLLQTLQGAVEVRIDLSELVDIDTAGVQLLIAYRREAARLGIGVDFSGGTPALAEALRLLGLEGALRRAGAADR